MGICGEGRGGEEVGEREGSGEGEGATGGVEGGAGMCGEGERDGMTKARERSAIWRGRGHGRASGRVRGWWGHASRRREFENVCEGGEGSGSGRRRDVAVQSCHA